MGARNSNSAYIYSAVLSPADFDLDREVDSDDMDSLVMEIAAATNRLMFDLTSDGVVGTRDLTAWLTAAAQHNGFGHAYSKY